MTLPSPPPACPAYVTGPSSPSRPGSAAADLLAFGHADPGLLFGPELAADPGALYELLRHRHGPVAPVLLHDHIPAWLVIGYAELNAVLHDGDRFSADPTNWRELTEGRVPEYWPLRPAVITIPNPRNADGDEHIRLRTIVTASLVQLSPRRVRRIVEQTADELIRAFSASGHADLIGDFARLLPGLVMARLLGVPEDQAQILLDGVTRMVDGGPDAIAANEQVMTILRELVAAKSAAPGHDLISWMLTGPGRLPDEDNHSEADWQETVTRQAWVVLCGGLEVAQTWMANATLLMLTSSMLSEMRGGRLTVPDALSQALWQHPPVQNVIGRYALTDVPLGRIVIERGDMVILGLAAAGADPVIQPDLAAAHRSRAYPAFGIGPHACPAPDLGEQITRIATEHLLQHVPGMRLADNPDALDWRPSLLMRGLASLNVTFPPFTLPTRAGHR